VIKDLSVRVHDCPNCKVNLDRDLNASLVILKRTVGQPFAACGGLVSRQPVRQELSFVNLRSPRRTALSG
jgi:putative transposase